MIPVWYAATASFATGLLGYVGAQLWPIVNATRLSRLRTRALRQVAELRRLMAWTPTPVPWEAGMREDRWSLPVSPRLTDQPRIAAAKANALELPVRDEVETAAHRSEPNWHRNEHRLWTWGWCVEVVQRLASIGATPRGVEPEAYRGRHYLEPGAFTEEFNRIVVAEFGAQRCDSCATGWDPEPAHASCVGCSCPCSVVEPLPEGVEGHAIAGATR